MTFNAYKLTPVDTWFFRDGRPYNQGESNLADIKSLFPPFAVTAVGAIRASLARSLGWIGKDDWPVEIKAKLGDGEHLGNLRFKGPYLVREKDSKNEILFPAPLHLLGKLSETEEGQWEKITLLKPGKGIDCDIGDNIRLPTSKDAIGLKSLYGCYLTSNDMDLVLEGCDLSKISPIKGSDLWDFEFVVGIERNFETRTTVEGALYSISRVRLKPGVGLAVEFSGIEEEIELQSPLPLGGEGKLAYADRLNDPVGPLKIPELKSSNGKTQFTVTHLTPAYFEDTWPGPGEELPGIPGTKVVSACIERPVRIGGWDTVHRKPLPLKPFVPEGSTWFCEADRDHTKEINLLKGIHIGKYCKYGFGEIAIGLWNDEAIEGIR